MAQLTLDEYTLNYSKNLLAAYALGFFAEEMSFDAFCALCHSDYLTLVH